MGGSPAGFNSLGVLFISETIPRDARIVDNVVPGFRADPAKSKHHVQGLDGGGNRFPLGI